MHSPPKFLAIILEFLLPPSESFHLMGSYEELYREKAVEKNIVRAVIWYFFQILIIVPDFISDNISWGIIMFFNNLKITIRNINKNKSFTFISVLSLMIGITALFYAIIINQRAHSTDQFYKNINNIYRLGAYNLVAPIKTLIKDNIPEVEAVDFFDDLWCDLTINKNVPMKINKPIVAGPDFEKIFSVRTIEGNLQKALSEPLSVAITQHEAERIFGVKSPIGEILKHDEKMDLVIKAVIEDQPDNTTIKYGALVSASSMKKLYNRDQHTDWNNWNFSTFLLAKEGVDIKYLEEKINSVLNKNKPERVEKFELKLNPLDGLNMNPVMFEHEFYVNNSMLLVISFIALLILITGILNYTNMSIARATLRAKEICIRKTTGANRGSLFKLFMSESVLVSLLAISLSVIAINFIVKKLNADLITINVFDPIHLLLLVILTFIIATVAGIYPAYFLTSIEPVKILKGETLLSKRNNFFKKGFIVFQISVSVFLIMCSIIINDQLSFILNRDPGFKTKGVVYFSPGKNIIDRIEPFKNELKRHENIEKVACGFSTLAGTNMTWGRKFNYKGEILDVQLKAIPCDQNYVEFMGLEIISGRNFNATDTLDYIVNEAFVKKYCPEDPFTARFQMGGDRGKIVGIVKDFNFNSLKETIEPAAFIFYPGWIGAVNVQLNSLASNDIRETLKFIENTWYTFSPDSPFEYDFVDNRIKRFYQEETELKTATIASTAVAVLIAALGLFSFVTFSIERRTKEIGIRKVLGATEIKIVRMIGSEFFILTTIATIIAIPCSYYLMNQWLSNFVYKSEISFPAIFLSVLISFLVTLSVVGIKIIKAARNNPVDSLKYE